jgi:hypothetical protein
VIAVGVTTLCLEESETLSDGDAWVAPGCGTGTEITFAATS